VDERRQIEALRELELLGEAPVLGRRLLVVADLADRDDAVLAEIARQQGEHAVGDALVVRLLGLSASVQKWRMPNWLARNGSQPRSDAK
jgi:hypothetical protein